MSDLIQSVQRTVLPNGEIRLYTTGMLVKRRPMTNLDAWRQWLSELREHYGWNEKHIELTPKQKLLWDYWK